jgi:transposase
MHGRNFLHKEMNTMPGFRLSVENHTKKVLSSMLERAQKNGDLRMVKRVSAILALIETISFSAIRTLLGVTNESIRRWIKSFLLSGPAGLKSQKRPGRPSKLTKSQKKELSRIIIKGPEKAGFPGECWRSPMIQNLIYRKFRVCYSVCYISQLLKSLGFSYQKAKFVADHKDPETRQQWIEEKWPEIYQMAVEKNAYLLFGDEASFPQWGTLSYTWAIKGQQPIVKTSGNRKSYKIFGLIDYFSGRFFCKGQQERLNSESYATYLKEVLSKTRKHIILIQDGAKYHTSKTMQTFFLKHAKRITVFQLPSYSPDYNPIEKLWKKIKQHETHMHYFPTFESLKNKVTDALLRFENMQTEILTLFGFYRKMEDNIL